MCVSFVREANNKTIRVRVKNDKENAGHKYTIKWPNRIPAAELSWGVSGEDDSRTVEYVRLVFERGAGGGLGTSRPTIAVAIFNC